MRIICEILLFMSAGYDTAFGILSECPTKQEIPSCEDLQTSGGFTYHVPDNAGMHLTDDCEHGWYYLNGTCIADSTDNGKKSGFVRNLTMSTCLNLEWQVDCPNSKEPHCKIIFSDKMVWCSGEDLGLMRKYCSVRRKKVIKV
ncbi:hypothetical protein IRJ41_006656 [Triplophysa rosa]|uniref:Sushi domain-containing protein n=1 Tax=Triplophysa rosa TaxID=992332 RepID=A0A9W7WQ97_TRIRA|nr:hypothetical protein IRJ41_006656 [Triplophysa rosa]